jgi:hypothetical protein
MRNARYVCAARFVMGLIAAGAWLSATPGGASTPSATECAEGAEFIGNAALARDTGMARERFIDQMQSDFSSIRAFPNELRWFVHDAADEAFLLSAAQDVFDRPKSPDLHRVAFFRACMNRLMV